MFKRCEPKTDGLWLCDVCLKTEIEPVDGQFMELRKMWQDEDEQGLVLCSECKD